MKYETKIKKMVEMLQNLLAVSERSEILYSDILEHRSNISNTFRYLEEALKKHGVWDIVNDPENTKYAHSSVPYLLRHGAKINEKVVDMIDSIYYSYNGKDTHNYDLSTTLFETIDYYNRFTNVKITTSHGSNAKVKLSKQNFSILVDMLITSSIKRNPAFFKGNYDTTPLEISITIKDDGEFTYTDNGIPTVYDPNLSKDVLFNHFWIINNILTDADCKIITLENNTNFTFIALL